jgi:phytanoyl-CoA dioxygenase PhyH
VTASGQLRSPALLWRWADQLPGCRPVRVVAFEKTEQSNWSLPWHQDRVIAVREKHEVAGFSTWSRKGDVWHCEPPLPYLDRMMFARLHIDAANETNGGLELALGTHKLGRVSAAEAHSRAQQAICEMCVAEAGDVLLAKALTLHRSQSSSVTRQRRAIRIDFSADHLPPPLQWAD